MVLRRRKRRRRGEERKKIDALMLFVRRPLATIAQSVSSFFWLATLLIGDMKPNFDSLNDIFICPNNTLVNTHAPKYVFQPQEFRNLSFIETGIQIDIN